jgi:hypothetical protein
MIRRRVLCGQHRFRRFFCADAPPWRWASRCSYRSRWSDGSSNSPAGPAAPAAPVAPDNAATVGVRGWTGTQVRWLQSLQLVPLIPRIPLPHVSGYVSSGRYRTRAADSDSQWCGLGLYRGWTRHWLESGYWNVSSYYDFDQFDTYGPQSRRELYCPDHNAAGRRHANGFGKRSNFANPMIISYRRP